eukprot:Nitzschia sp. Nitz4//scaffold199_size41809//17418//18254//NITZ4_007451-RA/size41809-processed-gene-0.31-mRNA-1//-1//CDS//3329540564//1534//frame0
MTLIWIPNVPDSIDGAPLATQISDFWFTFPYHRLPPGPLAYFLRPEGVIAMLLLYLGSKPIFKYLQVLLRTQDAAWFKAAVALHNAFLAVFSFVVAWNAWPIVVGHLKEHGFHQTYCDPQDTLWQDAGLGVWNFIFYLSKYYEFMDTWVLVLKGKKPSLLQVYHHTGVAFCMWMGVLSHSSWLKYVTMLNSIIHTLMYIYFCLKTIWPKLDIPAAKNLTMAQIAQFFTGIIFSFPIMFLGDSCNTSSSRFALAAIQFYAYGLVALFMSFAKRKYKKDK